MTGPAVRERVATPGTDGGLGSLFATAAVPEKAVQPAALRAPAVCSLRGGGLARFGGR